MAMIARRKDTIKAVLFRSKERFGAFERKLRKYDIEFKVMDFERSEWLDFDYTTTDILIYYPSFKFSSNHPLALAEVYDNLSFIGERYPHVKIYPDIKLIKYYNDKYRQFLFLKSKGFPIPETIPLTSEQTITVAGDKLGYPMVVKNRYGAGGGAVYMACSEAQVRKYYNLSRLNLFNLSSAKELMRLLSDKMFYYHLIRERKAVYPFLSPPLLGQKFVSIDRDLKTVVHVDRVVEAHWRLQAGKAMWKMNIDGGGIGVWSRVPEAALSLSVGLAKALNATWLNIDMIMSEGTFLITEFSPVWHHYAYKEKPSFVYKDDYNISVPLELSLDLEEMIVVSLLDAVGRERQYGC
jgi:glutathione synthase/RimK-type ligase-like ATP-grasp enzyme